MHYFDFVSFFPLLFREKSSFIPPACCKSLRLADDLKKDKESKEGKTSKEAAKEGKAGKEKK